jgi:16S rRNA (guanine(966)-N(2))-methyltransferase RsmD
VRPILAQVKKSLFDIIKGIIYNANFIDLFSGVGTVGLEALSCYAGHVTFVESNSVLVSCIKHNIDMLNFTAKTNVIQCDLTKKFYRLKKSKFNIVFMDPPYEKIGLTYITLNNIVKYNIVTKDSIIISKRNIKEKISNIQSLHCIRNVKYGNTGIFFYKTT